MHIAFNIINQASNAKSHCHLLQHSAGIYTDRNSLGCQAAYSIYYAGHRP